MNAVSVAINEQQNLLDVEAASKYMGFSRNTIYNLSATKKVTYHKRGKKLLFDKKDLDVYLDSITKTIPAKIEKEVKDGQA